MSRVLNVALRPGAFLLVVAAGSAVAATSEVTPAGFIVSLRHETRATPAQLYEALGRIGQWWDGRHTYSSQAANLSLPLQAGGCFCERWGKSSVEHARVVFAGEGSIVRLSGALGPLQALAVQGVLDFSFKEREGRTTFELTYRVVGNATSGLDRLAGPVDGVLAEAARRLVSYAETGKPD